MAMPSSLVRPFTRFLHTTSCARVVASGSRAIPLANDPEPEPPESSTDRHTALTMLMDKVSTPYDFTQPEPRPHKVKFNTQGLIRPIDFHRDTHKMRPRRKIPALGPGREARYTDIFLQLGIDPRKECANELLMSSFTTKLGRILPRSITGLTQRSQRFLGKAIKRAKMMGVVPMLSNSRLESKFINRHQIQPPSQPPNSDRKDSKQ